MAGNMTVEQVQLLVRTEAKQAIKEMNRFRKAQSGAIKDTLSLDKGVQSLALGIAKTVAPAALAAGAFYKMSRYLSDASDAASAAEEIHGKFNAVFKDGAKDTEAWAEEYSRSVGRSTTATMEYLAAMQDTFVPLGFARDAASEMSKTVVKLAYDLASFNNIPVDQVMRDIQSATVGNTETLRKYGVVANQASIEAEALASGLWSGEEAITAQEKAQAILQLTMKGTTDAQGDLLRTQDSHANVTARLADAQRSLKEEMGKAVNEGLTPFYGWLADITAKMAESAKAANEFRENIKETNAILADESPLSAADKLEVLQRELQTTSDRITAMGNAIRQLDERNMDSSAQRKMRDDLIARSHAIQDEIKAQEILRQEEEKIARKREEEEKKIAEAAAEATEREKERLEFQKKLQDAYRGTLAGQLEALEKDIEFFEAASDGGREVLAVLADLYDQRQALLDQMREEEAANEPLFTRRDILASITAQQEEQAALEKMHLEQTAERLADQERQQRAIQDGAKEVLAIYEQWSGALGGVSSSVRSVYAAWVDLDNSKKQAVINNLRDELDYMRSQHEDQIDFLERSGATNEEIAEARIQMRQEEREVEAQLKEKEEELAKKEFERNKLASIANATMKGAEAFVQTLASVPFPANVAAASAIAGMTAAQIGLISSQSFPGLYEGGIVPAQGESGGLYRLGDKNRPEAVVPLDRAGEFGLGGGVTVQMNGTYHFYGAGGKTEFIRDLVEAINRGRKTNTVPEWN